MRFTVPEAFAAAAAGRPIVLAAFDARQIVERHYLDPVDFLADRAQHGGDVTADEVFAWLGY